MLKILKQIQDKMNEVTGEKIIHVSDITLSFVSESDGKTIAEYKAETGTIKKEDKEWNISFEADGEIHVFPIEYAFEEEQTDEYVTLQFDFEDDEYAIVKFRF